MSDYIVLLIMVYSAEYKHLVKLVLKTKDEHIKENWRYFNEPDVNEKLMGFLNRSGYCIVDVERLDDVIDADTQEAR